MQLFTFYFICKLLYMFRLAPSLIIRSTNNCIYSIWYLSQIPDAVETVVCAPDDEWCYHPKHVEQTLHLVGYILEYS
jgi:hypothetical protein